MRQAVAHACENIVGQHALRRKDAALYAVNKFLRNLNPGLGIEDETFVLDEGVVADVQLALGIVRNAGVDRGDADEQ